MATTPCPIHLEQLNPSLTGCPGDDEYLLFLNVASNISADRFGFRRWRDLKECLFADLLGPGIVMFRGSQLTGSNEFQVTALDGFNEVLFYNGVNRFLIYDSNNPSYPQSEWIPLVGGGVQILIPGTYTFDDVFFIFPNGQT